jgi:TP901 family phage tail tape measure protein
MLGESINVQSFSKTMAGFGVASEETDKALDSLWRSSQATGTSINELLSTLSTKGAIFQSLGLSVEESANMLGVLNKAGLQGDAIITQMVFPTYVGVILF